MENFPTPAAAMGGETVVEEPAKKAKRFPWLEWFLVLAGQVLFFQAVPSAWTNVMHGFDRLWSAIRPLINLADVRNWSIVGYIVALSIVLVVLVTLKIWRDRRDFSADVERFNRTHRRRD